ncbi:MAG: dTMP kinase [Clostridia bacterium]
MSQGKLIVIESGTDASGKATQSQLLLAKLENANIKVRKIEFPNYESKASYPVQMYLRGEFGSNPDDINAFAASTFFAIDRYASYIQEWKEFYQSGGVVIADRYTTSNMVHQGSKIHDKKERIEYLEWLADLEYKKIGLPEPDLVVFLNVDPKVALNLMDKRNRNKDIHETNKEHLLSSYKTACEIAIEQKWTWIDCIEHGRMRSIEDISDDIFTHVKTVL